MPLLGVAGVDAGIRPLEFPARYFRVIGSRLRRVRRWISRRNDRRQLRQVVPGARRCSEHALACDAVTARYRFLRLEPADPLRAVIATGS